jgi:hypothetical protein
MSSSSPSSLFVTFNLLRCDAAELTILRDLFRHREARCLHLTGAVPEESVPALEAEAESHAADARRVELALAAQIAADTARRARLEGILDRHRAAAAAARVTKPAPAPGEWSLDGEIDGHNLDGFACPDDLRAHGNEMREKGAPPSYVAYCAEKARAMVFRAEGWLGTAKVIEENCEKLYREIPKAWQW